MSIIKNALNKQIQADNLQQFNDTTATILEYDIIHNTAKIRFLNPNGSGYMYRDNVQVSNTLGGVTGSGIFSGQTCTITFVKNNIYTPVITGLHTNNYSSKTNTDQGSYLVSGDILSYQIPDSIVPMKDSWIEESNSNTIKYNNDLGDYTDVDSAELTHKMLNTLDKYKETEQGITNLDTKSSIKLKENGDIDIFVSNNTGIRISNTDHKIYLFGLDFVVNGTTLSLEPKGDEA